jgi:hypothetical protein
VKFLECPAGKKAVDFNLFPWCLAPAMKSILREIVAITCLLALAMGLVTPVHAARTSPPPPVVVTTDKPVVSRY